MTRSVRRCAFTCLAVHLLSASASAAIAPGTTGNGELFLNVHDTVNRVSFNKDLGIRMDDFFIQAQQNEGYQRFWVVDSVIWESFLASVGNPAALEWSIAALDSTGNNQPGNQRLFTTGRQGQEDRIGRFLNSGFSAGIGSTQAGNFFTIVNAAGTNGTPGLGERDYDVHGESFHTDAEFGAGYYGSSGGLTPTFNNNAPFSATNLVGRSSWFYYLTRSGTNTAGFTLVDEFDNGNSAGTANGRDGFWGFIRATDPATTLPEWQGKYLLSFTMPAFSPVLMASTRLFAADIGRTEYSGGYLVEALEGRASPSGLGEPAVGAESFTSGLRSLAMAVTRVDDLGLPALLSPIPEPGRAALFCAGLIGLAWARRRRLPPTT